MNKEKTKTEEYLEQRRKDTLVLKLIDNIQYLKDGGIYSEKFIRFFFKNLDLTWDEIIHNYMM